LKSGAAYSLMGRLQLARDNRNVRVLGKIDNCIAL